MHEVVVLTRLIELNCDLINRLIPAEAGLVAFNYQKNNIKIMETMQNQINVKN